MSRAGMLLFLSGLGLAIGLIAWRGFDTMADLLAGAGWDLLWLPVIFLLSLAAGSLSWRLLFPPERVPSLFPATGVNLIGLSVNWLLPVAQLGGEVVRARLIARHGVPGSAASASVVVDKTLQALSQPVFALVGLILLARHGAETAVLVAALACILLLGLAIGGFCLAQRYGMFGGLARTVESWGLRWMGPGLARDAAELDADIRTAYRRRARFLAACAWRAAARLPLMIEVWVALHLLGHPVGFAEAVVLETLAQIVVAVAFAVPGAVGVQEGGFMLIGAAIGVGPDAGLALSLAIRARELVLGVPALLAWQVVEARSFARR